MNITYIHCALSAIKILQVGNGTVRTKSDNFIVNLSSYQVNNQSVKLNCQFWFCFVWLLAARCDRNSIKSGREIMIHVKFL